MTQEEALKEVMQALAPGSLSALQIDIFCRSWNKQSYQKIAGELAHEYSYIKDVGGRWGGTVAFDIAGMWYSGDKTEFARSSGSVCSTSANAQSTCIAKAQPCGLGRSR